MNVGTGLPALALTGAAFLFLIDLMLSVLLVAVSALSRVGLHRLAESGPQFAFVETMRDARSPHRTATLLTRQISLLGGVLLVAVAAGEANWSYPVVSGIALGALVGVLLLELLVARLVGLWDPRLSLRGTAFLARGALLLMYPVVWPLHGLLRHVSRYQRGNDEATEEEQEEEVEAFIEVGEREGILEPVEGKMMRGIADLDETDVREIMTPRTDIAALPMETTIIAARGVILEKAHSRLPVYRETLDNVVGILHERDLLRAWEEGQGEQSISRYLRDAMFVTEALTAAQLLSEMRLRTQVAIVVDEYGGVSGLVTLEDVLEEIVGDIRDEHDTEEAPIRREPDGAWIVNAATHIDELRELFGLEVDQRDFDTVGGLVIAGFGHVPVAGETLEVENLSIEVLEADPRRIRLVRIRSHPERPGRAEAGR